MSTRCWLLLAQLVLFTLPHEARADDRVQECIGEHVEAQLLRKQGHLVAARARLLECAAPSCPALVREECVALRQEVEVALPSVTLNAVDANGQPTSAPTVSIDGSAERVPPDGRSVVLDPGEHQLHFQHPDGGIREVKLVLAEAEHDRPVVADFRPKADTASPLRERRWPSTVVLASAGVAAVALGSFTYFALSGHAVQSDLERCKPDCDQRDVDRMRSRYLVADVSLGVALVAAGIGTYALLQAPSPSAAASSPGAPPLSVSLQPLVTDRQVGLSATGEF
jgi:hypothetical protein